MALKFNLDQFWKFKIPKLYKIVTNWPADSNKDAENGVDVVGGDPPQSPRPTLLMVQQETLNSTEKMLVDTGLW